MIRRVFVPPPCTPSVVLDARQSHHLVRVLRIRAGETVEIFDGTGRVWRAVVKAPEPGACAIECGSLIREEAPPHPEIHLAQALLGSDSMDRLLRQATELGANQFWPLTTARTQAPRNRAETRYDHWHRIIVGACEQSRRAYLPRLNRTRRFDDFIGAVDAENTLLLHPEAQPLHQHPRERHTTILVGPEGGWKDEELTRAQDRGIRAFSLGTGILRAETAPLAAIAAIRHSWGWR